MAGYSISCRYSTIGEAGTFKAPGDCGGITDAKLQSGSTLPMDMAEGGLGGLGAAAPSGHRLCQGATFQDLGAQVLSSGPDDLNTVACRVELLRVAVAVQHEETRWWCTHWRLQAL